MTAIASMTYGTTASYTARAPQTEPNSRQAFDGSAEPRAGRGAPVSPSVAFPRIDSRESTTTASFRGKLLDLTLAQSEASPIHFKGFTWELPEEDYQNLVRGLSMSLEADYTQMPETPDLSSDPRLKTYATVVVDRRIAATIDNQGVVGSENDVANRYILDLAAKDASGGLEAMSGPSAARDRAQRLASLLGGEIVTASTAMSQSQFDALPELAVPQPTIDVEAMKSDPRYAQLETLRQNRDIFLRG